MKKSNFRLVLAVGLSGLVLSAGQVPAADLIWDGDGNGQNGKNWGNPNAWVSAIVPGSGDTAVFDNLVYTNPAYQPSLNSENGNTALGTTVAGLTLINSSAQTIISIPAAGSLTVTGSTLVQQDATIALTENGAFTPTHVDVAAGRTLTLTQTTGQSTGAGALTIPVSGTLSGAGTIAGNVTVNGTHAPGNSPGIQTVNGTLNYSSTSIFEWELFSNTDLASERGVAATGYDAVNVNGSMTANGLFKVVLGGDADFNQAFWKTNHTWAKVFDVTSNNITGNFTSFALYDNAITPVANLAAFGSFSFDTATGALNWSAVPEPTSALVGLVLGAGLLRRRRTTI